MQRFRAHLSALSASAIAVGLVMACTSPDDPGVETGEDGTQGGSGPSGSGGSVAGSTTGGVGPGTGGTTSGAGGTTAGTGATSGNGGATSGASGAGATGGMGGDLAGTSGAAGAGGRGGSGGGSQGGGGGVSGGSGSGTGGSGGAMPSTGCGKAPPASNRYSIDVSGTMREYILYVPSDYDSNRPYRLVFTWHPLGGSAQQVAGTGNNGYYGLRTASNGAAILVSPEGLPFQGTNLGWANTNGRDIAFLRAMLDRFKAEMCIDEARIFSTGFSFGGMMSFAVGCSGLARAIAPMAGNTMVSGCANGSQPVAMMGFHGDHDSVVAIEGGEAGRDVFVMRNGCMSQTMPANPTWCTSAGQNFQPCNCVSYQGCNAGYPVTWCEYNGDHMVAPNSGATIWNFFAQF